MRVLEGGPVVLRLWSPFLLVGPSSEALPPLSPPEADQLLQLGLSSCGYNQINMNLIITYPLAIMVYMYYSYSVIQVYHSKIRLVLVSIVTLLHISRLSFNINVHNDKDNASFISKK